MAYALITGASKGIGKSLAESLAKRKYNILLVARSEELLKENAAELEKKYGIKTAVLALDLSAPDAAKKIAEWCTANNFDVTVLVNNAGYGLGGAFHTLPLADQLNMMQLNMQSLVSLTYLMIPVLKKTQQKTYILNVGSTAAHQAVPYLGVYSATKAFVLSFSRAIFHELKDENISVTCLCPGPTDTNFIDRANMGVLKEMAAKFEWPPAKVAKVALSGMFAEAVEVIPGFMNRVSYAFIKLMPKKVAEKIAAGIYLKAIRGGSKA